MKKFLLFPFYLLFALPCAAQTAATAHPASAPSTSFNNMRLDASGKQLAKVNDTTVGAYHLPISGAISCAAPMSSVDFETLKTTITGTQGENHKLVLARQIVGSNCILAEQVAELVKLFGLETSKLGFAEWAYNYTYDRDDYYRVYNSLTQPSVQELSAFVTTSSSATH